MFTSSSGRPLPLRLEVRLWELPRALLLDTPSLTAVADVFGEPAPDHHQPPPSTQSSDGSNPVVSVELRIDRSIVVETAPQEVEPIQRGAQQSGEEKAVVWENVPLRSKPWKATLAQCLLLSLHPVSLEDAVQLRLYQWLPSRADGSVRSTRGAALSHSPRSSQHRTGDEVEPLGSVSDGDPHEGNGTAVVRLCLGRAIIPVRELITADADVKHVHLALSKKIRRGFLDPLPLSSLSQSVRDQLLGRDNEGIACIVLQCHAVLTLSIPSSASPPLLAAPNSGSPDTSPFSARSASVGTSASESATSILSSPEELAELLAPAQIVSEFLCILLDVALWRSPRGSALVALCVCITVAFDIVWWSSFFAMVVAVAAFVRIAQGMRRDIAVVLLPPKHRMLNSIIRCNLWLRGRCYDEAFAEFITVKQLIRLHSDSLLVCSWTVAALLCFCSASTCLTIGAALLLLGVPFYVRCLPRLPVIAQHERPPSGDALSPANASPVAGPRFAVSLWELRFPVVPMGRCLEVTSAARSVVQEFHQDRDPFLSDSKPSLISDGAALLDDTLLWTTRLRRKSSAAAAVQDGRLTGTADAKSPRDADAQSGIAAAADHTPDVPNNSSTSPSPQAKQPTANPAPPQQPLAGGNNGGGAGQKGTTASPLFPALRVEPPEPRQYAAPTVAVPPLNLKRRATYGVGDFHAAKQAPLAALPPAPPLSTRAKHREADTASQSRSSQHSIETPRHRAAQVAKPAPMKPEAILAPALQRGFSSSQLLSSHPRTSSQVPPSAGAVTFAAIVVEWREELQTSLLVSPLPMRHQLSDHVRERIQQFYRKLEDVERKLEWEYGNLAVAGAASAAASGAGAFLAEPSVLSDTPMMHGHSSQSKTARVTSLHDRVVTEACLLLQYLRRMWKSATVYVSVANAGSAAEKLPSERLEKIANPATLLEHTSYDEVTAALLSGYAALPVVRLPATDAADESCRAWALFALSLLNGRRLSLFCPLAASKFAFVVPLNSAGALSEHGSTHSCPPPLKRALLDVWRGWQEDGRDGSGPLSSVTKAAARGAGSSLPHVTSEMILTIISSHREYWKHHSYASTPPPTQQQHHLHHVPHQLLLSSSAPVPLSGGLSAATNPLGSATPRSQASAVMSTTPVMTHLAPVPKHKRDSIRSEDPLSHPSASPPQARPAESSDVLLTEYSNPFAGKGGRAASPTAVDSQKRSRPPSPAKPFNAPLDVADHAMPFGAWLKSPVAITDEAPTIAGSHGAVSRQQQLGQLRDSQRHSRGVYEMLGIRRKSDAASGILPAPPAKTTYNSRATSPPTAGLASSPSRWYGENERE